MTGLLVAVTFGALLVAGALGFYILRLTRHERDRSAARAAALAEALGVSSAMPDARWNDAVPVAPIEEGSRPSMFAVDAVGTAGRGSTLLAPVGGAILVGLALSAIWLWHRPDGASASTSQAAPLELVALGHQRQGESLVVSGLVRNPMAGRALTGLTAVAFTFDRQGTYLTTGRASIDFPRLAAGDESPFSVTVPQSSTAGRYRVSFRTDSGVIAHIDRRPPATAGASPNAEVTR